jgi:DNA processing protein
MWEGGDVRRESFGASMFLPPSASQPATPHDLDLIALSLTPFAWRRTLGERLRAGESPRSVLDRWLTNPRLNRDGVDRRTLISRASSAVARAADRGLHLVTWEAASYPASLAAIADPPPALWVRGDPDALTSRAVAIVGSRAGSPYAVAVAERLAGDLASRGILIVSGLARGVDSAAHLGAITAGGRTVAVMGCGADVMYPAEHRDPRAASNAPARSSASSCRARRRSSSSSRCATGSSAGCHAPC